MCSFHLKKILLVVWETNLQAWIQTWVQKWNVQGVFWPPNANPPLDISVAPRVMWQLRWQTRWHLLFGVRFGQWKLSGNVQRRGNRKSSCEVAGCAGFESQENIEIRSRGFLMASKPQQPAAPFADDVSHSHFEFSSAIWPSRAQQFSDCLICFVGCNLFSLFRTWGLWSTRRIFLGDWRE